MVARMNAQVKKGRIGAEISSDPPKIRRKSPIYAYLRFLTKCTYICVPT